MPQSPDLRAQLEQAVIRDLLGPANGPEEIVDERAVRERYLLGKLGPQGQSPLSGFDEILTADDTQKAQGRGRDWEIGRLEDGHLRHFR